MKGEAAVPHQYLKLYALMIGIACHVLFMLGVGSMMLGIYTGLGNGLGHLHGFLAVNADIILILQFPFVHSWLLTRQGNQFLRRLSPPQIAAEMTTTWFALIAAMQIFMLFIFWSPSRSEVFSFHGYSRLLSVLMYAASWIFLLQAMIDADLSLQSGLKGWFAVVRNRRPQYRDFPQHRSFAICRQPIYLAFTLILWTAPVWTLDRLLFASCWTIYCILGPRLKEKRYLKHFGARYRDYQSRVAYFLPWQNRRQNENSGTRD